MALRADLLVEVETTLDGSGDYTGDWIDSGGIDSIRVLYSAVGTEALIQESSDQTHILSGALPAGGGEAPLTMRYFRFAVDGGTPNAALHATVRVVGR